MTAIDGERQPGTIPNVDGATLTRLEAWSVSTGLSRAELVQLLVDGDATLTANAAAAIHRLKVGQATVPAGGPTYRAMRDALTTIELLLAKIAAPVEDSAPPGVVRGQGTTRPPAPTVTHVHTDPDGDRLTLLAIDGRPCDWSVVLTTADGEVERDVLVEDDEDLAKIALGWLTAIDRRER
mgnify:FL=1